MVFQLLIFFMLTSVAQIADFFPVQLPDSETAAEQAAEPVVILIGTGDELAVDNEAVTVDEISPRLRNRQGSVSSVLVKADNGANSGMVVRILEQVNAAGIQDVILATNRVP